MPSSGVPNIEQIVFPEGNPKASNPYQTKDDLHRNEAKARREERKKVAAAKERMKEAKQKQKAESKVSDAEAKVLQDLLEQAANKRGYSYKQQSTTPNPFPVQNAQTQLYVDKLNSECEVYRRKLAHYFDYSPELQRLVVAGKYKRPTPSWTLEQLKTLYESLYYDMHEPTKTKEFVKQAFYTSLGLERILHSTAYPIDNFTTTFFADINNVTTIQQIAIEHSPSLQVSPVKKLLYQLFSALKECHSKCKASTPKTQSPTALTSTNTEVKQKVEEDVKQSKQPLSLNERILLDQQERELNIKLSKSKKTLTVKKKVKASSKKPSKNATK